MTHVQATGRSQASSLTDGMSKGSIGNPHNGGSSPGQANTTRMETFRMVKPTCVSLMKIGAQAPTSYSTHAGIVDKLCGIINTIPPKAFTPDIINFILLPVTQILRHHDPLLLPDHFLEAVFRLLRTLSKYWKLQKGGMEMGAWEQLWRFTTASIAPRVVDGGKGKARAVGQEAQLQAVLFLGELLYPIGDHPTKQMLEKVETAKSPLMPTLFQTITLLLAMISPVPSHTELQLESIRLLRPLITVYLRDQSAVLASVLPGTISAISKLFNASGKGMKGPIATEAAGLVGDAIVTTLSDDSLRQLGLVRSDLEDLSQLGEEWEASRSARPPSPTPSTSASSGKDPFPPLTTSYLEFTSAQLRTSLRPILSALLSHTSHAARLAAASLSYSLLRQCPQSLPQLSPYALSTLLQLSQDDFGMVQKAARENLHSLLGTPNLHLDQTLIDLLSDAMNALPRLIMSHQEAKVTEAARLLTAIAQNTSESSECNPIPDLLGPRGKVERWGWALLDCLEFGRPTGWSAMGDSAARTTEKGWTGGFITSSTPLLLEGGQPTPQGFDLIPLRYIEAEAALKAINSTLLELGSAGGDAALYSVTHFISLAKANRIRQPARAASALWVAQKLLEGVAQGAEDGAEGKVSRATRKLSREITRIIVSMDGAEDDDDDAEMEEASSRMEEDSLVPVARQKGLDVVTTLLDRPLKSSTHAAIETRRLHLQAQRAILTALSLQTFSVTSRILSSAFRPLLLTVLYMLLSHLASPHHLVATYAEIALARVAYNTGYASVQNMILDNVDYVINVVSQRLTPTRLSPNAPLVLIAMIRLTRSEIVPLVHDIVDEIFDALDDYHGYEVLASGLLAVLVTLVDVMADDVAAQGLSQARVDKLKELKRLGKPPDPQADFLRFRDWWMDREKRRSEEVASILEKAPEHAWGQKKSDTEGEENPEGEETTGEHGDTEIPATRAEEIAAQILDKSLNFLSHRSPFLRARILSLIARAVPVLAAGNREGDLLPLIDRSWGIILLRLDDPLPYVVTEAAEVIASLCEHVGDFMSRRILDTVWPRLQRIVTNQKVVDDRSALARKGAMGTTSQWTVSHRLYMAILAIAIFVAKEVPVDDGVLWDMIVLFRPFLDQKVHEEIQSKAIELYKATAIRDEDAVWLVLQTTRGSLDGGIWGHLADSALDIGFSADQIFADA